MDETGRLGSESQLHPPIGEFISDRTALLQSALDALPIAIAVIDAQGITVAVNATCQRYVRETQGRSWLPGMSFAESLDSCPVSEVSTALRACLPALLSGEMQMFERTY